MCGRLAPTQSTRRRPPRACSTLTRSSSAARQAAGPDRGARPKPAGSRPRSEQISSRAAAEPVSKASALFAAGPTVSRKARVVARENVRTCRNVTSQRDHRGRPGTRPARRLQAVQNVEALPPRAPGEPRLLHHQSTGSLTLVDRQVLDLRKVRPTIPPKRACPGLRGHDDESRVVETPRPEQERARADTSRGRLTARGRGRAFRPTVPMLDAIGAQTRLPPRGLRRLARPTGLFP